MPTEAELTRRRLGSVVVRSELPDSTPRICDSIQHCNQRIQDHQSSVRVALSNVAKRVGNLEGAPALVRAAQRSSNARYAMTIPKTARLAQVQVNALCCTSKLILE